MLRLRRLPTSLGVLAVVTIGACLVFDGRVASNEAGVGDASAGSDGYVHRIDASEGGPGTPDSTSGDDGALEAAGGADVASDDAGADGGSDDAGRDSGKDSGKDGGKDSGRDTGVDSGNGAICGADGQTVCASGLKCCATYNHATSMWNFPTPACQASCTDAGTGGYYDYECDTSNDCPPSTNPMAKTCCAFRENDTGPPPYTTVKCLVSCPPLGIEVCQPGVNLHGTSRPCMSMGKSCIPSPADDLPPDYSTCGNPP
jgi:hypothetical protein